jgi:hypothetical protein
MKLRGIPSLLALVAFSVGAAGVIVARDVPRVDMDRLPTQPTASVGTPITSP